MKRTRALLGFAVFLFFASPLSSPSTEGGGFSVLVFNVFDPFFGPAREERMTALPAAIMALSPVPDVIVFLEAFKAEHRQTIVSGLQARGYAAKTVHYLKRQYGTGILLISRFPLSSAEFTPFRVDGALYDPEHYAGKGIFHYRLAAAGGLVELFATHPLARFKPLYNEKGLHQDRDRKTGDRLLEMEQIAQAVFRQTDPRARSVIVAGDLNVSPDMLEYQYLLSRTGLTDSFSCLHPDQTFTASTYSPENTFVDREWFRIDHILYLNRPGDRGFWIMPTKSDIVLREPVRRKNGELSNLSDHFGVLTVFETVGGAEAVRMSAFRPERCEGRRRRADLTSAGLLLTPANHLAWQCWAVELMDRADQNRNRLCPLLVPAARTVIAGEVREPSVIPLTSLERAALQADLRRTAADRE